MTTIRLTKLDAARRHLEQAISLFFAESDPVPIHTIVAAAYDVLKDLNGKTGTSRVLAKDSALEIMAAGDPDLVAKFRRLINIPQNFLKHADRDTDGILSFDPELTDFLLYDACIIYNRLRGELPVPMRIFGLWFQMQHSNIPDASPQEHTQLVALAQKYKGLRKQEFFNRMQQLWAEGNAGITDATPLPKHQFNQRE